MRGKKILLQFLQLAVKEGGLYLALHNLKESSKRGEVWYTENALADTRLLN